MTADQQAPPRLVFLLMEAERRVGRWISRRGSNRGISAAAAGVLFHVAAHPAATTGQVADALHGSAAGTSGLLARMESAGLIHRTLDPDDRRSIRISLAPAGKDTMNDVQQAVIDLNGLVTDGFSVQELDTVARWLAHVSQAVR
ncbi:MarR family transcriptional regulator [Arthrobacter sp. Sa2CUA1]|uniref:MarR family transcriptional regulator n=1 Tax=Arthrobacter gallicola TaxID=2762225 RepID=A0ABR8UPR6_9MICC|nr:MarR family transcriptional regulator [Arthrobacter gallicola]MBD7994544.1 MarR family transcriptional regulator [Arthrobacter gallicola]